MAAIHNALISYLESFQSMLAAERRRRGEPPAIPKPRARPRVLISTPTGPRPFADVLAEHNAERRALEAERKLSPMACAAPMPIPVAPTPAPTQRQILEAKLRGFKGQPPASVIPPSTVTKSGVTA